MSLASSSWPGWLSRTVFELDDEHPLRQVVQPMEKERIAHEQSFAASKHMINQTYNPVQETAATSAYHLPIEIPGNYAEERHGPFLQEIAVPADLPPSSPWTLSVTTPHLEPSMPFTHHGALDTNVSIHSRVPSDDSVDLNQMPLIDTYPLVSHSPIPYNGDFDLLSSDFPLPVDPRDVSMDHFVKEQGPMCALQSIRHFCVSMFNIRLDANHPMTQVFSTSDRKFLSPSRVPHMTRIRYLLSLPSMLLYLFHYFMHSIRLLPKYRRARTFYLCSITPMLPSLIRLTSINPCSRGAILLVVRTSTL